MKKELKLPFINKKSFKRRAKKCKICGEKDYDLLECHRIIPGEKGGKYENSNCVCLCVRCHTIVHRNKITIIGWKNSSVGQLLHIIKSNQELFL